jgi:hypothetical protein
MAHEIEEFTLYSVYTNLSITQGIGYPRLLVLR